MKKEKIIIGSRNSKLALIYAEKVKDKILNISGLQDDQIIIKICYKSDQVHIKGLVGKVYFQKY